MHKMPLYSLIERAVFGYTAKENMDLDPFSPYKLTSLLVGSRPFVSLYIIHLLFRLTDSQKEYFKNIESCYFLSILEYIIEWIQDGRYDFFDLPIALKKPMTEDDAEIVKSIDIHFKGTLVIIFCIMTINCQLYDIDRKFTRGTGGCTRGITSAGKNVSK